MAPDFEKFIRMSAHDPYSHTWRSIFYFNLPVGLLLCFIFHVIVRDDLVYNLPQFLSRRLSRFTQFNWVSYFSQNYLIVIISVLLGAASHIFWDSFTHRGGRAAGWLPFMENSLYISGEELSAYYIMQRVSSLIGALVVLYAVLKLPAGPPLPHRKSILPFWLTVTAVATAAVGLKFWFGEYSPKDTIFIYIAAMLIGLIAAPLILKKFRLHAYKAKPTE